MQMMTPNTTEMSTVRAIGHYDTVTAFDWPLFAYVEWNNEITNLEFNFNMVIFFFSFFEAHLSDSVPVSASSKIF